MQFIKTLNHYGYMFSEPDTLAQRFVDYCKNVTLPVLDIGPAFGATTIAALRQGTKVISIDLDKRHLAILLQNTPQELKNNITIIEGKFPNKPDLADNSLGAVLAASVLHYLPPDEMMKAFHGIYLSLAPEGRFFFSSSTPYLGLFKDYLPVYEERKKKGEPWPGFIADCHPYAPNVAQDIPKMLTLLEKEQTCHLFESIGFKILDCFDINVEGWPEDIKDNYTERFGIVCKK